MNEKEILKRDSKRFEILDVFRGFAILLVMFRHHEAFPYLNKIGWMGVSLFFVLSGYLISCLLFKELCINGKINIKLFYIRRGFKIYPGFYFFIISTAITLLFLFLITGHKADRLSFNSLIVECFFLQNYFHGFWYHTWSIAVEEHFYLLFPLILSIFKFDTIKNNTKFYLFTCLLIIMILFLRTTNFFFNQSYEIYRDIFATHLRIDGLIFGVMIGYDQFFNKGKLKNYVFENKFISFILMILLLLPSLIFTMESPVTYTLGFTTISLAFSILILLSLNYQTYVFKNKIIKFFIFIGTCSYAIYLWQGYVLSFIMRFIEERFNIKSNSALDFIIFFFISIFLGWMFTKYLENYFLTLRQKYFPSKYKK